MWKVKQVIDGVSDNGCIVVLTLSQIINETLIEKNTTFKVRN